jgi:hypothetical protein
MDLYCGATIGQLVWRTHMKSETSFLNALTCLVLNYCFQFHLHNYDHRATRVALCLEAEGKTFPTFPLVVNTVGAPRDSFTTDRSHTLMKIKISTFSKSLT